MNAKRHTTRAAPPPLPAEVADVAVIAAGTCAAIGEMSVSWWNDEVRAGRAPKPVIQQPRFTRWRLVDVRRFWAARADLVDTEAAAKVTAQAKKASIAAGVKRAAQGAEA